MKLVKLFGLFLIVSGTAFAQPVTSPCSEAVQTYASFANTLVDFARKNAEVLTIVSQKNDSQNFLEAPLALLYSEAQHNIRQMKKHQPNRFKCTLNYALYLHLANQVMSISHRSDIQSVLLSKLSFKKGRVPASVATLSMNIEEISKEIRKIKRKSGIVNHAFDELQSAKCIEQMKSEGEFKALSDQEASVVYTQYLNRYVQQGGRITQHSSQPLQSAETSQIALKKEIAIALKNGETVYASNLQEMLDQSESAQIYVARRSFHACAVNGIEKLKVFIPRGITLLSQNKGQNEFIYEDASLWNASQAVQYSNTAVEQFPVLVMKNKVSAVGAFFQHWVRETAMNGTFARE